ncbi:unnamed protein product [Orchesella dallaii]|uniref:Uncharacterized protein n=1 Tax=Orchesella dallaii TaxID=48710 RepID=A0ABP1R8D9_9HEXA
MATKVIQFVITLVAIVAIHYLNPAAAKDQHDVELVDKLPTNKPKEVENPTELPGKADNITTLSETPNTIMQEPPYNYSEEVGITGYQRNVTSKNFSMERIDDGKTNISNSQEPEFRKVEKKDRDFVYLALSVYGLIVIFTIIYAIFMNWLGCFQGPIAPTEAPSTSTPVVTFQNAQELKLTQAMDNFDEGSTFSDSSSRNDEPPLYNQYYLVHGEEGYIRTALGNNEGDPFHTALSNNELTSPSLFFETPAAAVKDLNLK